MLLVVVMMMWLRLQAVGTRVLSHLWMVITFYRALLHLRIVLSEGALLLEVAWHTCLFRPRVLSRAPLLLLALRKARRYHRRLSLVL